MPEPDLDAFGGPGPAITTNSAKSQSRNSKSPVQSLQDLGGSSISFGKSVIQNGFKNTVEDVFANGASD